MPRRAHHRGGLAAARDAERAGARREREAEARDAGRRRLRSGVAQERARGDPRLRLEPDARAPPRRERHEAERGAWAWTVDDATPSAGRKNASAIQVGLLTR